MCNFKIEVSVLLALMDYSKAFSQRFLWSTLVVA